MDWEKSPLAWQCNAGLCTAWDSRFSLGWVIGLVVFTVDAAWKGKERTWT